MALRIIIDANSKAASWLSLLSLLLDSLALQRDQLRLCNSQPATRSLQMALGMTEFGGLADDMSDHHLDLKP